MTGDASSTIKCRLRNLLRSPSHGHRKHRKESLDTRVALEKVLGITASGNSGLACDPHSGLLAYPAGCVVVLLNPKNNRQHHIINTTRKTITALSFSPDGKYLVTGESGHLPAVRLWDMAERRQVAELQKHKYGISCVAFSPNAKYIVSVGNQHDMLVNVWAWKKDMVVAANKVSSKVTAVSFSEDSSYFVTAGIRHVKFWYLDPCKPVKSSAPVPLLGRSGLLGELRNNFFCDVACGRGSKSDSTFCITSSGLLCEFNAKRTLDKWVDLRTGVAQSLSLSEDVIFCGCADGMVRCFGPADLCFVCTLPRPHPLGTDVSAITQASHLSPNHIVARYPDVIALTYDPASHWLSCVYNDHSVYVWDVRNVDRVTKVNSALFHAACVWDLQMLPDIPGESGGMFSPGVFVSCSADNTIRLWCVEGSQTEAHNVLSDDLLKVIYVDENTDNLLDPEAPAEKCGDGGTAESRAGIRSICVSPDGKHLASGDRSGILRVHDLGSMEEVLKVEAHNAEILSLEYSKPHTGLHLLATASRDRLIHVFNAEEDYGLLQTLDEHSSSITAVRFAANDNKVRLISCGADKSIYFRTAHRTDTGTEFRRSHHVVGKTTLYDMGIDPTCKYAAVGCQDRGIRIFNISSGKQKKLYKGSLNEDGSLLKVQMDPSGHYVATSCSDKNISIFDFHTGDCVANMFGHSEVVTGMKFTNDCKHLISVSGDSCIFLWRLAPEMTINMRERLRQLRQICSTSPCKTPTLKREVYSAPTLCGLSSEEDGGEQDDPRHPEDALTTTSSDSSNDTGGEEGGLVNVQTWEATKVGGTSHPATPDPVKRPRRRWSRRIGSLELMVKSMLDLRQLEGFSPKKSSASSLQEALSEERVKKRRPWHHSEWLFHPSSRGSKGPDGAAIYPPEGNQDNESPLESSYVVVEQTCGSLGAGKLSLESQEGCSPDSVCSLGYYSRESSPDPAFSNPDVKVTLGRDSSDEENEGREEDEEEEEEKKKERMTRITSMDEALRTVMGPMDNDQEDFLKQNFETLGDSTASSCEQSSVQRLSMSSRFLAEGHRNRRVPLFAKACDNELGMHCAKPPVSTVRPMMEGSGNRGPEDKTPRTEEPKADGGVQEKGITLRAPSQKKRPPGTNVWRLSHPTFKTQLLVDCPEGLQKSQSVQNLVSCSPRSPVPSSERASPLQRSQRLLADQDSPRPSFCVSSPSTSPGSPGSPQSPLPWESPKPRPRRSYMSHTTSSMAKCSRSSSLGEGLQAGTPPPSPPFRKRRRSSGLADDESLPGTSPPVSNAPSSHPLSSSLSCPLPGSASRHPAPLTPTISPNQGSVFGFPQSRIPLPKQLLGPRRSLCLEMKPNLDSLDRQPRTATPVGEPAHDADSVRGSRRILKKRSSLSVEPASSSTLLIQQKRDSVSESVKDPIQEAGARERPLVLVQASAFRTPNPQHPGVTQLHPSIVLSAATPPPARRSTFPSVCPSTPPPASLSPPAFCPFCCHRVDNFITMETCRQAVCELQDSLRRTAMLYSMALSCGPDPSKDQQEMREVLSEALSMVRVELDSLPSPSVQADGGSAGDGDRDRSLGSKGGEGERALALLEQYSELLLKSVVKRLDSHT